MFSIIMPLDINRLQQFRESKLIYDDFTEPREFIIPTRDYEQVSYFLKNNNLIRDVKIAPYYHKEGFNPSKALNIGTRWAKYQNIIITSPEVKPTTKVLTQLSELLDKNVVCQVFDQAENGNLTSLVHNTYRSDTPAMYFLAMFHKKAIEKINGWDENFMDGYAYEDNDFGERWVRAKIPFEIHDEIQAIHLYHPRGETTPNGLAINNQHFLDNRDNNVIRPENGLSIV